MNFITKFALVTFLCLMIPNSYSEETYTLKLVTSWGENFPVFSDSPKRVAAMVNAMSNGRLTIDIISADEHGQPLNIIEMVKSAEYDMGHSASYYWKGNYPNTLYFSTMPFGMLPLEQYSWFYFGGGQELMDEVYNSLGLISVPGGNTGAQMGGWFQKRIKDVSSFDGLRMRIPGFAGEVLAELGAIPVNVPATELLDAMNSGEIQAVEYVGPALDFDLNLHLSAQFYYTGWHEPATETQFLLNEKALEILPADLKAILYAAMRTSAYDTYIHATHLSAEKWNNMRKEFPVIRVKDFPDSVISALKLANSKKLEEFSNSDPLAKKIIQSQLSYQSMIREWTMLSDFSYLESIGK
ncbi:TRAP transporter substrate-binding protein [Reinekea sp.]|jgi:TRAP-type mannitol/chloroaromatic compound transport system substrate-binding protein|uniref:TRAP transporter substrate-binding protein n=1 Tax=Reinekea sp. TaxID=1970455 RepID=UPI003989AAFF